MSKHQKGFTLIELVMVIVVLGILAAVAVPKFVNLQTDAENAAKAAAEDAVKSAFTITIGQLQTNPTVTQLAANVDGGTAIATGVQVTINSVNYTVQTYTDAACTLATAAVGNTVLCVGNLI